MRKTCVRAVPKPPNGMLEVGTYYTYLWLREDGSPYYVGKGRWQKHGQRAFRLGCPTLDRIIIQEHPTEDDAFFAEKFFISYFGRKDIGTGILRNLTDGGEGPGGIVFSEAHIRAISVSLSRAKKGKPIPHYDPVAHSALMTGSGNPMYGKKRYIGPEWRAKLSSGRIGHAVSEETRRKMALSRTAKRGYKPKQCYRGHEFTPENTWVGKTGSRFCLKCRKINHDIANAKNKEKREASRQ